jgi:hypothetical protein
MLWQHLRAKLAVLNFEFNVLVSLLREGIYDNFDSSIELYNQLEKYTIESAGELFWDLSSGAVYSAGMITSSSRIATWQMIWAIGKRSQMNLAKVSEVAFNAAMEISTEFEEISYGDNVSGEDMLWEKIQQIIPCEQIKSFIKEMILLCNSGEEIGVMAICQIISKHQDIMKIAENCNFTDEKLNLPPIINSLLNLTKERLSRFKLIPQITREFYLVQVYCMLNEFNSFEFEDLFWNLVAHCNTLLFVSDISFDQRMLMPIPKVLIDLIMSYDCIHDESLLLKFQK